MLVALLLGILLLAQDNLILRVVDPGGLPVPRAEITVRRAVLYTNDNGEVRMPTDVNGRFEVFVDAAGFEPVQRTFERESWGPVQQVELKLGSTMERVSVTASRAERISTESPASISVIDSEVVRTTPSRAVDDLLRQLPGFSLLRRTGSVAAHPTSQGVSMRGVGASGASRTLVLADGIPINDPFGTWVYWNRVPKLSIDSIEVVRGAASDLYGSSALGGVIHMRTRRPAERTVLAQAAYGQRDQADGSVFASDVRGPWGYSVAGEIFRTDGYIAVAEGERGAVDTPVALSYRTALINVDRNFGSRGRAYSSFTLSTEDRENGTPLTRNDTNFRQFSLGGEVVHGAGQSQVQAYVGSEGFDSSFSSVAAGRSSETLTSRQRVPVGYGGIQGMTTFAVRRFSTISFGADYRKARGVSHEINFNPAGAITATPRNGGSQRNVGGFVQYGLSLQRRFSASASLRWDSWSNEDLAGAQADTARRSGKVGLTYRFLENLSAYGSYYQGFRAPTLNELYRPFRVGNALTLPNLLLGPETMRGSEGGLQLRLADGKVNARAGVYSATLSGTVANITLSTTPQLITRQRQNLGRARARGLETEVELRPHRFWTVTAGYLLSNSKVSSFPSQPNLVGLRLPQVPKHQYSLSVMGTIAAAYRVNVQARGSGDQFENDINTLVLERYFALDAYGSRSIGNMVEFFVAGENITDEEIQVGRAGVTTLGMPRTFRTGLNFRLGSR